jgi:hypothetical protein
MHYIVISNFNINCAPDLFSLGLLQVRVLFILWWWTKSMEQSHPWEANTVVLQLVKKFLALYATYRFSTMPANRICLKFILIFDVHLSCNSLIHTHPTSCTMFVFFIQCSYMFRLYILATFRELQVSPTYSIYGNLSQMFAVIYDKLPYMSIKLVAPWRWPKHVGALYNKYKHCAVV